jgi:DNA gyrase/topoisomerase IV subunit A
MVFPASDVTILKAAGKGVTGIKLHDGDAVFAFDLSSDPVVGVEILTEQGRQVNVCEKEFKLSNRGARGRALLKRGSIVEWRNQRPWVQVPVSEPSTDPDPTDELPTVEADRET